jgi:hypothetical protein
MPVVTPLNQSRPDFTIPEFGGDTVLEFSNLAYYVRSQVPTTPAPKSASPARESVLAGV